VVPPQAFGTSAHGWNVSATRAAITFRGSKVLIGRIAEAGTRSTAATLYQERVGIRTDGCRAQTAAASSSVCSLAHTFTASQVAPRRKLTPQMLGHRDRQISDVASFARRLGELVCVGSKRLTRHGSVRDRGQGLVAELVSILPQ
jgi:hypothetical protein